MNRKPLRAVTEDEIAAYERDGAACLRGMFDQDWIARMQRAVDYNLDHPGDMVFEYTKAGKPGRFHGDLFLWLHNPDFRAFVLESPCAEIAGRMMRASRCSFFYDQLFVKEPGTQERTPWHQDQPYWPVSGDQVCSIWIALDPVTLATGAVEYIKGSHRWNKWYRPQSFTMDDRYASAKGETLPDIDAERDKHEFVHWDMQPGDVLVHHALTVHGSSGNSSNQVRRRGHSTRWCGDDARWDPRPGVFKMPDPGIAAGAPMECELFPRVWEARSNQHT